MADEVAGMRRGRGGRIVPLAAVSFGEDDLAESPGRSPAGWPGCWRDANGLVLSCGNEPDMVLAAMQTAASEILPHLREQRGT